VEDDFVVWEDGFSVDFEPIDLQHKALVEMANTLFEACRKGAVAADIAFLRTVRKAVEYARTHFATEENYMSQADYPGLQSHKKEHEDFVFEVIKAVKEFETGNTAPITMARFLKNWLLNHIAVTDKQYSPYLKKLSL
jgi:hemerythrin